MRIARPLWAQLLAALLATCMITGGAWLIHRLGLLRAGDHLIYDLRMYWRGPLAPTGELVLVLMDEASSAELQRRKGTWSRAQLAQALENLCGAGAEIIGLDLILAAPDADPAVDHRLARVMADCNNLVLARVLSSPGAGEIQPLALFREAMIGDGLVDVHLDEDEVLRRVRFLSAKPYDGGGIELLPAFALELARTFLGIEFDLDLSREDAMGMGTPSGRQLWLPYPELLINYAGAQEVFPRLSYADVVKGRFEPESVEGKLVLIGSSLFLQKDFFVTPFSRFEQTHPVLDSGLGGVVEQVDLRREPGVVVHANAVDTILAGRYLRPLGGNWLPGLTALAGLLGLAFYLPRLALIAAVGLLVFYLGAVLALSYEAFCHLGLSVDVGHVLIVFAGQWIAGLAFQRRLARRKARLVQEIFGKYVSPEVVRHLVEEEAEISLEGQRCDLTVLFSDLREFTALSEQLDAKQTARLLNRYFDTVIPVVLDHRGTVDKLMGDAIMAFFGAPVRMEDHATRAAEAALGMLQAIGPLRQSGVPGADRLCAGIGISTGSAILGNLGSRRFMDYTVLGDTVNLGSRLEGLNKVYGTHIIVSEATAKRLGDRFLLRELDRVRVKGKQTVVVIYELVGMRAKVDEAWLSAVALFHQGLAGYRHRDWWRAAERFRQVLDRLPEDGPSRLYLERIESYRHAELPEDWTGVTAFDHK
jgi:adenylate cyclase